MDKLQRLVQYCNPDHVAPSYGKRANSLETIGTLFLTPAGHCLAAFRVKQLQGESGTAPLLKKIMAIFLFILILPITLLGTAIKQTGSLLPHKISQLDDAGYKSTDPVHIHLCYEQLRVFKDVCIENGFVHKGTHIPRFYAASGSALGALRHQGMIPWDDDVDTVVLEKDEKELLALEEALNKKGILLDRTQLTAQGIYKLKFTDAILAQYQEKHHLSRKPESPDLDIFIWAKTTDACHTFRKILPRCTWPDEYFTQEELDGGAEEVPFGEPARRLTIPILKRDQALTYLKRYYGEDCMQYGIKTHGHARLFNRTIPFIKFGAARFALTHSKNQCAKGLLP